MEASSLGTAKPLFSIQAKNARNSPRGKGSPTARVETAAKVLDEFPVTSSSTSISPKKVAVLHPTPDEDEKEDSELVGLCHPPNPEYDDDTDLRKRLTGIDLAELEKSANADNP